MYNSKNWEKSKERFAAFWAGEMIDRATVFIGGEFDEPIGDTFAVKQIPFVPAGHCGYIDNVKIEHAESGLWVFPSMSDSEPESIVFNEDNPIFQQHIKEHKELVENSNGQYIVGNIDNVGSLDALAHLRGSAELLMDMYDNPEAVKKSAKKMMDIQKFTTDKFMEIYIDSNSGTATPWMGLWCPERSIQAQIDISVMMSPEMFEEFALPEIEAHAGWVDKVVYHLDGMEQVKHLDMLLACKAIKAIQWTDVAGQPKTAEFIPVLQRIQKAGKSLVLFPGFDEIDILTRELSHKGLHLRPNGLNAEQAREAMNIIERNAHE